MKSNIFWNMLGAPKYPPTRQIPVSELGSGPKMQVRSKSSNGKKKIGKLKARKS